jgi:hypothetical protein
MDVCIHIGKGVSGVGEKDTDKIMYFLGQHRLENFIDNDEIVATKEKYDRLKNDYDEEMERFEASLSEKERHELEVFSKSYIEKRLEILAEENLYPLQEQFEKQLEKLSEALEKANVMTNALEQEKNEIIKKRNEQNKQNNKEVDIQLFGGVNHLEANEVPENKLGNVDKVFAGVGGFITASHHGSKESHSFDGYRIICHIKDYLDEMDRKISWLQDISGIPYSTLRTILLNEKSVTLENAYKLSITLGMPIERLFSFVKLDDK